MHLTSIVPEIKEVKRSTETASSDSKSEDHHDKLMVKTTTISTNPVFFLKHIDDAFQAHLCLLSSLIVKQFLCYSFINLLLNVDNDV